MFVLDVVPAVRPCFVSLLRPILLSVPVRFTEVIFCFGVANLSHFEVTCGLSDLGFADEVTGLGAKGLATDPIAFDDFGRISDELGRLERFELGVLIPGVADVGRFVLAFEILFVGSL